MQEIASAYRDVGLSGDFHSGAAAVYENLAHLKGTQPTRSAADMAGELADHAAKVMGASPPPSVPHANDAVVQLVQSPARHAQGAAARLGGSSSSSEWFRRRGEVMAVAPCAQVSSGGLRMRQTSDNWRWGRRLLKGAAGGGPGSGTTRIRRTRVKELARLASISMTIA
eukprot:COSAG01_NODE_8328_length_2827_cov_4.134164_1_plen_169_part_00